VFSLILPKKEIVLFINKMREIVKLYVISLCLL